MNKKVIAFFLILLFGATVLWAKNYFSLGTTIQTKSKQSSTGESSSTSGVVVLASAYDVEVVARGLRVPWAVVFTDEDRILVTEREGTIREVRGGTVNQTPLLTVPAAAQGEAGLMGMVLDPDYRTNKKMYVCYTYQNDSSLANRVIQLKDNGTSLVVENTLLDNAPAARFHAGCELAIGPDNKLYITFGDAQDGSLAQKKDSLAGKILRMNLDGSVPSDNPFSNSLVWSYGHRNPQGITWNPANEAMYSAEHGPSGNDGPLGGDEINYIKKGANYGWPTVSHQKSQAGLENPLLVFTPAVAPASAHFYTGDVYPEFRNTLLFATLRGKGIYRAVINQDNDAEIAEFEKVPLPDLGRIREVTQGPDGYIYITTSNTDGRGAAQDGDDKILRIIK